jgi:transposase
MKDEILKLRISGKTYNEIAKLLKVSKSTINYHCKKHNLDGRSDGKGIYGKDVEKIKEFYRSHTTKETSEEFNLGIGSVKKVVERKNKQLTDDEKKTYNYFNVRSVRKKNKIKSIEYKGGKCEICGYNKCVTALEFHHLDPKQKDFTPSKNMNMAWEKIKSEIDKCMLLCANCHREVHFFGLKK